MEGGAAARGASVLRFCPWPHWPALASIGQPLEGGAAALDALNGFSH